jgi:hypothetical protein
LRQPLQTPTLAECDESVVGDAGAKARHGADGEGTRHLGWIVGVVNSRRLLQVFKRLVHIVEFRVGAGDRVAYIGNCRGIGAVESLANGKRSLVLGQCGTGPGKIYEYVAQQSCCLSPGRRCEVLADPKTELDVRFGQ